MIHPRSESPRVEKQIAEIAREFIAIVLDDFEGFMNKPVKKYGFRMVRDSLFDFSLSLHF